LNGSDLLTLDDQHQPMIIDRLSRVPTIVRWIDDSHILAIGDAQSFSIRSVSSRQGRGVLLEKTFTTSSTVLAIDTDKKNAVIQTSSQPLALEELHW
jgi:endo-1,4-beta-mannosidase